jgi:Dolichyl-phosphate-mannose-protein mannosyltransferase
LVAPETKSASANTSAAASVRVVPNMSVVFCCLLFLLCGLAILPYPGVQNDEALFAAPLYPPKSYMASVSIFHVPIPIMQMSYLGCLKGWIYKSIFSLWAPSVFSLRVPVLIFGAVTIWLFWLLLRLTVGERAANIGPILLATDTSFLLTTCFDWGPVALQNLLMLAGVVSIVCSHRSRKESLFGLGFFLFGLGLWNKALFSWILIGLTVATLVIFSSDLFRYLNWRRALIAILCFSGGSLPLILSNLQHPGSTFGKENVRLSTQEFGRKFLALRETADGSALLDYLVSKDRGPSRRFASSPLEYLSISFQGAVGKRRANLANWAFVAAVLLLPFLWSTPARRPMLFSLTVISVAWGLMAATKGAGASAHHCILLWPFPIFFTTVAFAHASNIPWIGRKLLTITIALLVLTNLLVTNSYLAGFIENGGYWVWDDGIFALADYLKSSAQSEIYTVDWGMFNSLRLLNRGILRLHEESFILEKRELDERDVSSVLAMICDSKHILVGHTANFEAFPGINGRLRILATKAGYDKILMKTVYDQEGRPVFEVFHYRRAERSGQFPVQRNCPQ